MRKVIIVIVILGNLQISYSQQRDKAEIDKYIRIISENIYKDYKGMFREAKRGI